MAITYQQIEAAADDLVKSGVPRPSVRAVRDKVGGGASMNDFAEHMRTWNANRPSAPVVAQQLSTSLVATLVAEINKSSALAKGDVEQQLQQLQVDYDSLIAEGKNVGTDLAQTKQQLNDLSAEHARTLASLDQTKADLENANAGLAVKAAEAEAARKAEAIAVVNADNAKTQVQEKQATIQDLLKQLDDSQVERRALSEKLAVKSSEVASTLQRLDDAKAQSADLASRIKVLEAKLQSEQEGRSAAQAAAAAADARALAATAQAEEREKRVVDLQKMASAERDARVIAEKEIVELKKLSAGDREARVIAEKDLMELKKALEKSGKSTA
jgi:chromosome segregation ATPase